jgi:hypothetical protein
MGGEFIGCAKITGKHRKHFVATFNAHVTQKTLYLFLKHINYEKYKFLEFERGY